MTATTQRLKELTKRFLQLPADALIASSKTLPRTVVDNPYLSDKFYPYKSDQTFYLLLKSEESNRQRG